jgi:hypothetical protein
VLAYNTGYLPHAQLDLDDWGQKADNSFTTLFASSQSLVESPEMGQ